MTTTATTTPGPVDADRRTAWLMLGALGVVFGDIGTSPLYAMREIFRSGSGIAPTESNVLGALSLIVWSLILVITVKYVAFVMRADNRGEGGLLALLALIGPTDSRGRGAALVLIGLFGTALIYGDGVITPAISVLSAVEGFEVAAPSFDAYVVPLAIAILVALFAIQRQGTGRVGSLFGPVMLVWFATLGAAGAAHVLAEPGVVRALLPSYAIEFFQANAGHGFIALGAVFLAVTGGEALYADMGHFGRRPIAMGWLALVLPALLLNYAGQAAAIIDDPTASANPFYELVPDAGRIALTLLATAATVIASQALISAAFSLTLQAIQLDVMPRVRIVHTSVRERGQIYVPLVNWVLMLSCVGLVIGFGSSTRLAAAYGVAVATTMVITTLLLYRFLRVRRRWSTLRAGSICGAFMAMDASFMAAALLKVPNGGWFPLLVAAFLFTVMTTWRRGRELIRVRLRGGHVPVDAFLESIAADPPPRVPGTAVYLHRDPAVTPPALLTSLRAHHVLHEQVVLLAVSVEDIPRVYRARRTTVRVLGGGFVQVVLHYGFTEQPDVPRALADLVSPSLGLVPEAVTYVLGIERAVPGPAPGMLPWRDELFAFLHRNAVPAALHFRLPMDRVIEVGQEVEI